MRARLGLATATPRPCFLGRQCPRKHGLAPERWGWTWGDRALATPQRACGPGRRRASGRFGASPSIGSSATPGWEPRPLGTGQSRVPTAGLAGRGPALCRLAPCPGSLLPPRRLCSSLSRISDLGSRAWGVSPAPTQRGAGRAHSLSRGWSRLGRGRGGKACLLLGTENASGEPSRSPSPGVDLRARPAVSPSQPGCDASPRWAVSLPECCDRSPPGPSPSLRCAAAFSSDLRSPGRGLLALLPVRQFPGSEVPALRFVTAAASWTQDPAC